MALIKSLTLELNSKMPSFSLQDVDGNTLNNVNTIGTNGVAIIFTCNHCPYAIAVWPRLIELSKIAKNKGINFIAINPNIHPDYPEDSPENMKIKIKEWKVPFPYLIDNTQDVARQFKAQCTPDIYLYSKKAELFYHGRIDDNWQNPSEVKEHDLKNAIYSLSENKTYLNKQYASIGCSIKWKN